MKTIQCWSACRYKAIVGDEEDGRIDRLHDFTLYVLRSMRSHFLF